MTLLGDVRLALRYLARTPIAAAAAILTLAAATAFNVVAGSILDALLLHPYPYRQLGRLMLVRDARRAEAVHQGAAISIGDFLDLGGMVPAFDALTAWRPVPLVLTGIGDPERVEAAAVTANFFDSLGATAAAGVTFAAGDDGAGRDTVIVVSHRFWVNRLGSPPVGTHVGVNGRDMVLVGVIPDDQCYPSGIDAWIPMVFDQTARADRRAQVVAAIGRLRPDASIGDARGQLAAAAARLASAHPDTNDGRGFDLLPMVREQYEFTVPLFVFAQAAALLVLVLAAINLANIAIARALDRTHELATRAALGASRGRLAALVTSEWLVIGVAAGTLAAALAAPVLRGVRSALPDGISRWVAGWSRIHLDSSMMAGGFVAALGAALLVGVVAAIAALAGLSEPALRQGSGRATLAHRRLRRLIAAGEVCLSAVLLVAAGTTFEGFQRVNAAFGEFAPARLLRFTLTLPDARYPDTQRLADFHARLRTALEGVPDVSGVALIRNEPASNVPNPHTPIRIGDDTAAPLSMLPQVETQVVSAGALELLHAIVSDGRSIGAEDVSRRPLVALVSVEAVRRFWPRGDAVGSTIRLGATGDAPPVHVVGVVSDVRLNWFDPQPHPVVYLPDAQWPARTTTILVRTRGDPMSSASAVRDVVRSLDDRQPIASLEPFTTTIGDSLSPVRILSLLLAWSAVLAVVLAGTGIYGVLAQWVAGQRRALGIRLALGADRPAIARMVIGEAGAIAIVGALIAVPAAFGAMILLRGVLLGLPAVRPALLALVATTTAATAVVAATAPALSAARIDPAELLRNE